MMSATAEARIKGDRKPRYNLCGSCGQAIGASELLCEDCRVSILVQDAEGEDGVRETF
jgi:hypothetical protein